MRPTLMLKSLGSRSSALSRLGKAPLSKIGCHGDATRTGRYPCSRSRCRRDLILNTRPVIRDTLVDNVSAGGSTS
jgi:hypothetical protein